MKKALYFTAPWCGPCQVLKPRIQSLGLPIQFIDVDQNQSMAQQYGVRNVPTIILINNGTQVSRMVGNNINTETIKQFFN